MASRIGEWHQCRACGVMIAQCRSGEGKTYTAQQKMWQGSDNASIVREFLPAHKCVPSLTAQAEMADVDQRAAIGRQTEIDNGLMVIGQTVEVVKGRKVPIGTIGVIFWTGLDKFGGDRNSTVKRYRYGIDVAGVRHYTAQSNVRIIIDAALLARIEMLRETCFTEMKAAADKYRAGGTIDMDEAANYVSLYRNADDWLREYCKNAQIDFTGKDYDTLCAEYQAAEIK